MRSWQYDKMGTRTYDGMYMQCMYADEAKAHHRYAFGIISFSMPHSSIIQLNTTDSFQKTFSIMSKTYLLRKADLTLVLCPSLWPIAINMNLGTDALITLDQLL